MFERVRNFYSYEPERPWPQCVWRAQWHCAWIELGELFAVAAQFPVTPTRNTWRVWMGEDHPFDDEPLGARVVVTPLDAVFKRNVW